MEGLLLSCLEVSLGAALVIAFMLLLARLAGKHFTAKWRYWIWLALVLRLLLPFNIHLTPAPIQVQMPEQELTFAEEQPLEDYSLPTVTLPEKELPLSSWEEESGRSAQATTVRSISLWTVLAVIWLAGAAGSMIWQLLSYGNYRRSIDPWSRPVNDPELLDLYQSLCQEMNVSKLPQLLQNRRLQSPMMIGLFQPAILLPELDYSQDDYLVILSHELNHYKRHDLWYKLLLIAARCVHWFNPLVYGMLRAADNDLEISCDEAVVKNSSQEARCQYCEAILRIMCRGKGGCTLLSTGFNGGKKVLQRRFAAVLNDKAHKGVALGALSLALVVICGTFVACELVGEKQEPQPDEEVLAEENNPLLDALLSSLTLENYPDATLYSIQRTKEYLSALTPDEIGDIFADGGQLNELLQDSYWDSERDGRPMMRDLTIWVKATGEHQRSIEKDADKEVFYRLCQQVEPSAYSGNPPTGGGYTVSISAEGKETQYHFLGEVETGKIFVAVNEDAGYELNMSESQLTAFFEDYLQLEPEKTPEETVQSQPMVPANQNPTSTVNTAPASNSGKPFQQAFQGLDVHSTEAYQTVSYYTVDQKVIKSILDALDGDSMKEAKPKQVLVTYDVKQSGHFIRLVTDNMEQFYLFKDHHQALYRDFAGNSTYYDVDSSTYEKVFTRIKEVQNWKQNPISGDRYSPFHDDYNTLDIYATQSPETMTYTLSIRTFCEMLIDDLNWEQTAQRLVTEDYLSGVDLSNGHYIRISTDTGRMLYIYKDYNQAVYYTGHGFETYYMVPAGTYERVYKLLNTYRLYQTPGTSATENRFLQEFTQVSVSLHDDGANQEPEVAALNRERSFRMMADIPSGYFVRAEKKENLDL